jgi:hypothetical protein
VIGTTPALALLVVLAVLLSALALGVALGRGPAPKPAAPAPAPFKSNFEEDVKYLSFLVLRSVTNHVLLVLRPHMDAHPNKIINDTMLREGIEACLDQVFDKISPEYRALMSRYTGEEGFDLLVADMVLIELTSVATMKMNSPRLKKMASFS